MRPVTIEKALPTKRFSERLRQIKEATQAEDVIPLAKGTIDAYSNGDENAASIIEQALANANDDKYSAHEDFSGGEFQKAVSALQDAAETRTVQKSLKDDLFDTEADLDAKTRLSPRLVTKLQVAEMESLEHDTPLLLDFAEGVKRKRISLLGEGRKEGVEMEKASSIAGFGVDGFNRTKG